MKNIVFAAMAVAGSLLFSAEGAVVSGKITSAGQGVAGVPVSDGITIVTTDSNGNYSINTDKRLGYVFYTIPSGYEPVTGEAVCEPGISASLTADSSDEVHDFELRPVDNSRFDLVVITDVHLADRADDLKQFHEGFIPRIKEYVANSEIPVYTVALGDLTWDRYWYEREYAPAQFAATLREEGYPTLFFAVTGNHDNDAAVPNGKNTDFLAAKPFRSNLAPSYYSFNLGDAHIVVLDDIVYKNEYEPKRKYATGIVGTRNYDGAITPEQMEWLRQDLALVTDKTKPLIVCAHIPVWRTTLDGNFTDYAFLGKNGEDSYKLAEMMKDFDKVRILTGHTHYNSHTQAVGYPNIAEDNVSALCTQFWNTKAISGRMICSDGSPSAFKVYSFDGRNFRSRLEGVEDIDRRQFRAYDLNAVKNTYATDSAYTKLIAKQPRRTDYRTWDDNMVLVNVFDYQPGYSITITEDGAPLAVERVSVDDPLAIAAYPIPVIRETGRISSKDSCRPNNHMFAARAASSDKPVTITVTDPYGHTTTETLTRPAPFHLAM